MFFLHNNITGTCYRSLAHIKASRLFISHCESQKGGMQSKYRLSTDAQREYVILLGTNPTQFEKKTIQKHASDVAITQNWPKLEFFARGHQFHSFPSSFGCLRQRRTSSYREDTEPFILFINKPHNQHQLIFFWLSAVFKKYLFDVRVRTLFSAPHFGDCFKVREVCS